MKYTRTVANSKQDKSKFPVATCEHCDEKFAYAPHCEVGRFCSWRCRWSSHGKIIKATYTPAMRQVRRNAANNQWSKTAEARHDAKMRKFHAGNHLIGRPKGKKPDEIRVCNQCGHKFRFVNADRGGLFCSPECYVKFTKLNANNYRIKAFAHLPNKCFYCEFGDKKKLIVHHIDGDWLNNDIENLQILCNPCHRKQHKGQDSRRKQFVDGDILRGVRLILRGLRVDSQDENFKGTPGRVLKSFYEIYEGQCTDLDKKLSELFEARFPSEYDGIVLVDNIQVFSTCPHHLRDIEYVVDVGYISKKWAVGLSKLPRVVEVLARRLVLQETFTENIAETLEKHLGVDGVMVIVKGKHNCMRMRGVNKPDAVTTTSSVKGLFKTDLGARAEFMGLLKIAQNNR